MSSSKALDFIDPITICAQHIKSIRDALSTQKPPYCAGTANIPQDQYTLFYGPKGNAQYVKLSW